MRKTILPLVVAVLAASGVGCASLTTNTKAPSFEKKYSRFQYCAIEVTRQGRPWTCGAACLVSVMKYWGQIVSEDALIQEHPRTKKNGYGVLDLKAMAIEYGLQAYAICMAPDGKSKLKEQVSKGRPVICAVKFPRFWYCIRFIPLSRGPYWRLTSLFHTGKDHFVVVFGFDDKNVLLMDPAHGFAVLSWARFEDSWHKMEHAALISSS